MSCWHWLMFIYNKSVFWSGWFKKMHAVSSWCGCRPWPYSNKKESEKERDERAKTQAKERKRARTCILTSLCFAICFPTVCAHTSLILISKQTAATLKKRTHNQQRTALEQHSLYLAELATLHTHTHTHSILIGIVRRKLWWQLTAWTTWTVRSLLTSRATSRSRWTMAPTFALVKTTQRNNKLYLVDVAFFSAKLQFSTVFFFLRSELKRSEWSASWTRAAAVSATPLTRCASTTSSAKTRPWTPSSSHTQQPLLPHLPAAS